MTQESNLKPISEGRSCGLGPPPSSCRAARAHAAHLSVQQEWSVLYRVEDSFIVIGPSFPRLLPFWRPGAGTSLVLTKYIHSDLSNQSLDLPVAPWRVVATAR